MDSKKSPASCETSLNWLWVGYVEHLLFERGYTVVGFDPSKNATKLLEREGGVPILRELPESEKFDWTLLVAVEYAMGSSELLKLLQTCTRLSEKCLLISASFHSPSPLQTLKHLVRLVLYQYGIWRGQLWGFSRTPSEIQTLMQRAGFSVKQSEPFLENCLLGFEGERL